LPVGFFVLEILQYLGRISKLFFIIRKNKYINETDDYDEMAPRKEKKGILHGGKSLLFSHSG
jgi:hypothetical protein